MRPCCRPELPLPGGAARGSPRWCATRPRSRPRPETEIGAVCGYRPRRRLALHRPVPYVLHAPSAEQLRAAAPGTATGPSGSARYAGRQQRGGHRLGASLSGRDGHQLPPDGRCRRPPRAVPRHLRHARPVRRRRPARRSRGDHARRRGARRRRLRAARRRPGAGDRDPPSLRPAHAGDGHGRARLVLRPQGLRLRGAGRARQVLVRRRRSTRPSARSRTATTRSTGSRTPRGATAASGCGASRTTASRRWPRRSAGTRPWPASRPATSAPTGGPSGTGGGALQLNTAGYWAIAMDDPEYADLTRRRPVAPAAGRHGGGGGRLAARTSATPSTAPPTRRGGASAASRHLLADVRVPVLTWSGWYDNFTGEQLADLRADPGDAPGAGDGAPDGRAVGSRGQRRAHRPRRLRARATHRGAPLGRVPGVLRPLRDAGGRRGAGAGGRGVHAQRRLAAPATRGRRPAATPTAYHLRAGGVLSTEPPAGRRGARRLRLRPGEPGRGDPGRQLLDAVRGTRRPPRDRAAAGRRCRTPLPRSPPTSS